MYYVIEVQTGATGAIIPWAYDNQPEAEAKYHQLLSVAATSSVPSHGAMLFTDDLFIINHQIYTHTA